MNEQPIPDDKQALESERGELLELVQNWLEVPMVVLGFVWLILLGVELLWERAWEQNPLLNILSIVIWIIFIISFVIELI
ncbi:MAG: potassium channel protein, partial [Gemmatimonadota bacterium]|nr:potassium channel protein [Gemmatimonadota bacterium]